MTAEADPADPAERISILLDHIERVEDEMARLRAENEQLRAEINPPTP